VEFDVESPYIDVSQKFLVVSFGFISEKEK